MKPKKEAASLKEAKSYRLGVVQHVGEWNQAHRCSQKAVHQNVGISARGTVKKKTMEARHYLRMGDVKCVYRFAARP